MDVKEMIDGLKCNYAPGLHPTEIAEKDMVRTLRNMGFAPDQLAKLYDELLATCDFFPKVFDVHQAVFKLGLVRPDKTALTTTRALLDSYQDDANKNLSLREWLSSGGYEQICRDCHNDQIKIRKRLAAMGVVERPEDRPKDKKHKSDLTPILESPPDFPCEAVSSDVVVEYVDDLNGLDEL